MGGHKARNMEAGRHFASIYCPHTWVGQRPASTKVCMEQKPRELSRHLWAAGQFMGVVGALWTANQQQHPNLWGYGLSPLATCALGTHAHCKNWPGKHVQLRLVTLQLMFAQGFKDTRGFPPKALGREGLSPCRQGEAGATISVETELLDQAGPEAHPAFEAPVLKGNNSPCESLGAPEQPSNRSHQCIPLIANEMGLKHNTVYQKCHVYFSR